MKKLADILQSPHQEASSRKSRHYQKEAFDFFQLVNKWPVIVGDQLAKMATPLKIRQGTLYLSVTQGSYADHLHFLSEEIKKKIFAHFPVLKNHIKRLQYLSRHSSSHHFQENQHSPASIQKNPASLNHHSPSYRKKRKLAEQRYAHVEDESMRESLIEMDIQLPDNSH